MKKHWHELLIVNNEDKDKFTYAEKGYVWFNCECGYRLKVNIKSKEITISYKSITNTGTQKTRVVQRQGTSKSIMFPRMASPARGYKVTRLE